MKKLLALLLALVMVMSLAACGGGEDASDAGDTTDAATDTTTTDDRADMADTGDAEISDEQLTALAEAYNEVATAYNEVYPVAEANGWLNDAATAAELGDISAMIDTFTTALTEDPSLLDGSDFDALPGALRELLPAIEEIAARVSTPYSAETSDIGDAEITQEQLTALAEAYNQVAPVYNEAYELAEANGWLADATTAAELDAVGGTLGFVGSAMTEDLSMLDGSDFEALPGALLEFVPALEDLITRVSVPYAA
ncbi:MAG: hypothetical protein IJA73_04425 [Oscillospiraceae bacterium]|nr:hypothetical protein [Oscillospiraceae bacterium]